MLQTNKLRALEAQRLKHIKKWNLEEIEKIDAEIKEINRQDNAAIDNIILQLKQANKMKSLFLSALLLLSSATFAQDKFNPFPPAPGAKSTTASTYKQQCSGTTKKGAQCSRMVTITKAQHDAPTAQYCFQHKNK